MFTHVMVGCNDLDRSRNFYDATFGALGVQRSEMGTADRFFYGGFPGAFGVGKPANGEAATHANGGTVGIPAPGKEQVDAWHAAGLANGGTDEGAPGPRMGGAMYGAYLRDPDGNKLCASCAG